MTAEVALELFEKCAREHLDKYFARNTCIEQTRILIEVLKRFHIAAEPLATKLHVVVKSCGYQFFSSGDPVDHENARKCAKTLKRKASDRPDNEYGYHTVALVERRILVDATFAQVESEEFGFYLQPSPCVMPLGKVLAPDYLPDVTVEGFNEQGIPFTARWIGVRERDWEGAPAWEPSHLWPLIDIIEIDMWTEWLCGAQERWGTTEKTETKGDG